VHIRRDHGAHYRELQQMLGGALGIRTEVEHVGVTVTRADARDDRGAVDAVDRLQHETTGRHQRASVTCADARRGLAGFDEVDRHAHGRIFLATQSVLRLLVHRHDLRRLVQANARAQLRRRIAQELLDRLTQANEHDVQIGLSLQSSEDGGHSDARAVIAAHGVHRDSDRPGTVQGNVSCAASRAALRVSGLIRSRSCRGSR
jgi:hypothetical protein